MNSKKKNLQLWDYWPLGLFSVIFVLTLFVLEPAIDRLNNVNGHRGVDLQYFIINDYNLFIASAAWLVLLLLILIPFYKKNNPNFGITLFMAAIWLGPNIGDGISILLNTTNVYKPSLFSSTWPSHSDYLGSTWISIGIYVFLFLTLAVYVASRKLGNKNSQT